MAAVSSGNVVPLPSIESPPPASGGSIGSGLPGRSKLSAATMKSDDPILHCLCIPVGQRTKRDLYPLVEFVKTLKFFNIFAAYPEMIEQIASRLEAEEYFTGAHIFSEGDTGNHFYIILDGEVGIVKKKRMHGGSDIVTENILLVKLGCGQYFGENALENKNGLRMASAIAYKKCLMLALHRDDYQIIFSHMKELRVSGVKKLFRNSIFRHWSDEKIDKLARSAVLRTYNPNAEIFTAGTKVSSFMVIKSGIVKLIKPISKSDYQAMIDSVDDKMNVKTAAHLTATKEINLDGYGESHRHDVSNNSSPNTPSHHSNTRSRSGSPALTPLRQPQLSEVNDVADEAATDRLPILSSSIQPSPPCTPSRGSGSRGTQSRRNLSPSPAPSPLSATRRGIPNQRSSKQKVITPRSDAQSSMSALAQSSLIQVQTLHEDMNSPTGQTATIQPTLVGRANHRQQLQQSQNITPAGHWILTPSDTYLLSTRPMKVVTMDAQGTSTITSVNRDAFTKENSIEFTVATAMTGQIIGEICLLDPEQTCALSAVGTTTVELYCIDVDLLRQLRVLEDKAIMTELVDDWKFRNPPKNEIARQVQAKYEWCYRKNRIMNKVYDNHHRRREKARMK